MALTHEQARLFLNGAWHEGKSIKAEWKDMYGEEAPQGAIDELEKIISDIQDVMLTYMYEQKGMEERMLKGMQAQPKKQEECVAIRVHSASSGEDILRILTTPRK